MDADLLHLGDEVEGVSAMLALAEAIPDVFGRANPELRRIRAFVEGTRATKAVPAPLELVEDTVMFQDLLHGDGRFNGLEVNKR
jgi:hypothetical protein